MELRDGDFAAKKLLCYRGIARVPLHALRFERRTVLDKHRDLSFENVIACRRSMSKWAAYDLRRRML
jgi:hypothetical protein